MLFLPRKSALTLRAYGIDVEALEPPQAGQLIQQQDIGRELITALDAWGVWLFQCGDQKKETWKRLLRVAQLAEADVERNKVRLAIEREDIDAMKVLARADKVTELPPSTLLLFALAFVQRGATQEALDLLRKAQLRHPGDPLINTILAFMCRDFGGSEKNEDVRFLSAALAAMPQNPSAHKRLGLVFMNKGMLDEALPLFREAVRVGPDHQFIHQAL